MSSLQTVLTTYTTSLERYIGQTNVICAISGTVFLLSTVYGVPRDLWAICTISIKFTSHICSMHIGWKARHVASLPETHVATSDGIIISETQEMTTKGKSLLSIEVMPYIVGLVWLLQLQRVMMPETIILHKKKKKTSGKVRIQQKWWWDPNL